jgi:hypothetical protein
LELIFETLDLGQESVLILYGILKPEVMGILLELLEFLFVCFDFL